MTSCGMWGMLIREMWRCGDEIGWKMEDGERRRRDFDFTVHTAECLCLCVYPLYLTRYLVVILTVANVASLFQKHTANE